MPGANLEEREKYVHGIADKKSDRQGRKGGSLRDGEVVKQADNSATNASDQKTRRIGNGRCERPRSHLLFKRAQERRAGPGK